MALPLEQRVIALEALAAAVQVTDGAAYDDAARAVLDAVTRAGLTGAALVRVPADYYSLSLEARGAILACPPAALCKTLVFENAAASVIGHAADVGDARFVAVVLQYTHKLDVSTLEAFLRRHSATGATSLRAAPDIIAVTGFAPGGVTPFGWTCSAPVLVSKSVASLPAASVPFVWLGGGHPLVKLRVSARELCARAAGVVACTVARDASDDDDGPNV